MSLYHKDLKQMYLTLQTLMNVKQTMKNVVLMECVSTRQGPTIVTARRDLLLEALSVKASHRLVSQRKVFSGQGGELHIIRSRNARCIAQGCKLQAFLVSLRVFRTKRHRLF